MFDGPASAVHPRPRPGQPATVDDGGACSDDSSFPDVDDADDGDDAGTGGGARAGRTASLERHHQPFPFVSAVVLPPVPGPPITANRATEQHRARIGRPGGRPSFWGGSFCSV